MGKYFSSLFSPITPNLRLKTGYWAHFSICWWVSGCLKEESSCFEKGLNNFLPYNNLMKWYIKWKNFNEEIAKKNNPNWKLKER